MIFLICFLAVLIGGVLFLVLENEHLELNTYTYQTDKIGNGLNGYRILQVSDLHNAKLGSKPTFTDLVNKANPDIIVITGDLIDSYNTNVRLALEQVRALTGIAPIYYVTGNHESRIDTGLFETMLLELRQMGVHVLRNELVPITHGNDTFYLLGMDDPSFFGVDTEEAKMQYRQVLSDLNALSDDGLQVLLTHRPERIDYYADASIDVALAGHAHGGQFRLPFIGGLFAPSQGLFPKYTSGLYTDRETSLYVSRGVGNSSFPVRVFNRPELLLLILEAK